MPSTPSAYEGAACAGPACSTPAPSDTRVLLPAAVRRTPCRPSLNCGLLDSRPRATRCRRPSPRRRRRRRVRRPFAHAAAHVRVEREDTRSAAGSRRPCSAGIGASSRRKSAASARPAGAWRARCGGLWLAYGWLREWSRNDVEMDMKWGHSIREADPAWRGGYRNRGMSLVWFRIPHCGFIHACHSFVAASSDHRPGHYEHALHRLRCGGRHRCDRAERARADL